LSVGIIDSLLLGVLYALLTKLFAEKIIVVFPFPNGFPASRADEYLRWIGSVRTTGVTGYIATYFAHKIYKPF
jgi:hypothetical protein